MESTTLLGIEMTPFLTADLVWSIIRIGIISFVGLPLVYFLSRWFRKKSENRLSSQQSMIVGKLVIYSGNIFILISILNELGFRLTHLLAAAGIIGVAIGFASQTSISNIISGIFLIVEKPFQINDVVTIGSTTGTVISIDFLSVKIRTFDNKFVRIPNESVIKSEVINVTRFSTRRIDIPIGVAYKENITEVKETLLNVAQSHPLCLDDPEPLIIFSAFGESSMDFIFAVWAKKEDWLKVKNEIMEAITDQFDRKGIEIPFPHVSLYAGEATKPLPVKTFDKSDQ
ncbi:mechanosensitive ion channel family protein [candidate division KSB1 bacterium]